MLTRRELMAAGAVVLASQALPRAAGATAADGRAQKLALAASACVRDGEVCLQHCLELLAQGDKSLGECAKKVTEMLAVCRAVGPLADARSRHLAAMAALCQAVCSDCAEACRAHADHHSECKACLEACERTIAAARALTA